MNHDLIQLARKLLSLYLCCAFLCSSLPAQTDYVFRSKTEILLVNVTVRDKDGNFIRNLKAEDFTVLENKKPQKVLSFDLENTDAVATNNVAQVKVLGNVPATTVVADKLTTPAAAFKDRRMVVLFFDLSSMEPEEVERAVKSAQNYVNNQMVPADLVAVVSLGNSLNGDQDFTADKAQLKKILQGFNSGNGQGFEEGSTGTTEGTADTEIGRASC